MCKGSVCEDCHVIWKNDPFTDEYIDPEGREGICLCCERLSQDYIKTAHDIQSQAYRDIEKVRAQWQDACQTAGNETGN